MPVRTGNGLAHLMPELAFYGLFRHMLVELGRIQDKPDFLDRHVHGKIIHQIKRELQSLLLIIFLCAILGQLVQQYRFILRQIDKARMLVGYNRGSPLLPVPACHLDIKFVYILLEPDMNLLVGYHPLALFQSLRSKVAQYLQFIFRLADQASQRNGDRQAYHPRTGNPDSHGILQDIRTQINFNAFRFLSE